VYKILEDGWEDYRNDLYPKDKRMAVLREKNVQGMGSENTRFLINEIVKRFAKNGIYLEVGTLCGNSLLSAALFNGSTRCIGIDNFSQYDTDGRNKRSLRDNLGKFSDPKNIEFYDQDYREAVSGIFSKEPALKINVYYYDGEHSYESQVEGLSIVLPYLADKCIILVDDINMGSVDRANKYFLRKNPDFKTAFKVRTKDNSSEDWWNGFEVITRGF
jgi:protein O-GlcNAc transferase